MTTYSTNTFTDHDGINKQFAISFGGDSPGYIATSHVFMYINGVVTGGAGGTQVDGFTWLTSNTVELKTYTPQPGDTILFRRETPIDEQYAEIANTQITARILNLDFTQAVYGLQELYDRLADLETGLSESLYADLYDALAAAASELVEDHTHVEADITNLDKYTQAETDLLIDGKADLSHQHAWGDITDPDTYTQSEIDTFLLGKADEDHTHSIEDFPDFDAYTKDEADTIFATKGDFVDGTQVSTGIVDRTESTITFVEGTRTFTIEEVNPEAGFRAFANGAGYTLTTDSVVIEDTSGVHFIYYVIESLNPVLYSSMAPWTIDENTILIAIVLWNATQGKGFIIHDERHSADRNLEWHKWTHNTVGCRYGGGLDGTFTDSSLTISAGSVWDEDIQALISEQTTCTIMYRDGSEWRWEEAQSDWFILNGSDIVYDNDSVLTPAASGYFVSYWVFATTSPTHPIIIIVGQAQEDSPLGIRIDDRYENLEIPGNVSEMHVLYRIIAANDLTYYEDADDLRMLSGLPEFNYQTPAYVTYETLYNNGDVGTTAGTLAAGDDIRIETSWQLTKDTNCDNVVADPLFAKTVAADDDTYWTHIPGVTEWQSNTGWDSKPCLQVTGDGITVISIYGKVNAEQRLNVPATYGERWVLRLRYYAKAGFTGTVRVGLEMRNKVKGGIANLYYEIPNPITEVWTTAEVSGNITEANTAYFQPKISLLSTSVGAVLFDYVDIHRGTDVHTNEVHATPYLAISDIDDTPVNGETAAPISSNWAYDHGAAADPHTGYVLESAYTATDVLAKLLTVDGASSGIDADLLDGKQDSEFMHLAGTETVTGAKTFTAKTNITSGSTLADNNAALKIEEQTTYSQGLAIAFDGAGAGFSGKSTVFLGTANSSNQMVLSGGGRVTGDPAVANWATSVGTSATFLRNYNGTFNFYGNTGLTADTVFTPTKLFGVDASGNGIFTGSSITAAGNTVYHSGNDGVASGLDADLFEGQHGAYYAKEYPVQGAPTAKTTSATLTAAEIDTRIITVNNGAAGATTLTLPTAADMDTGFASVADGHSVEFSVINTSVVAAEDCTIATNTGWTLVGSMVVEANDDPRAQSSALFRAGKTGTAAWTLYKIS